jgi:hypothetical protein
MEKDDLAGVARLYDQVVRSLTMGPRPEVAPDDTETLKGLASYIGRLAWDQPTADEEMPCLVYEAGDGGIVGFIATYPRRFTFGGRAVRALCTGQLVAHPDAGAGGVGALLMRRALSGPQDLTFTDGATPLVREMWERLGGVTNTSASMGWTRPLRPVADAGERVGGRVAALARSTPVWVGLGVVEHVVLRRRTASLSPSDAFLEPLTPATLQEGLDSLDRSVRLRPVYDAAYLDWLFTEMAAVASRGELVKQAVRDGDGKLAGWFVAYLPARGTVQVVQVAGRQVDLVLDELFRWAAGREAASVHGRTDPYLYPHLREKGCRFSSDPWALVHSRDPELVAAVLSGRGLLTRLDGEWWMGHHRPDADSPSA